MTCQQPMCSYPSCTCDVPLALGAGLSVRDERQQELADLVERIWGRANLINVAERVARLVEEAAELAQAEGLPFEFVLRIVRHVYAKLPGDPAQELGGLGVTLLAYAASKGLSADACEAAEVRRIRGLSVEHLRARHQAKADAGIAQTGKAAA